MAIAVVVATAAAAATPNTFFFAVILLLLNINRAVILCTDAVDAFWCYFDYHCWCCFPSPYMASSFFLYHINKAFHSNKKEQQPKRRSKEKRLLACLKNIYICTCTCRMVWFLSFLFSQYTQPYLRCFNKTHERVLIKKNIK